MKTLDTVVEEIKKQRGYLNDDLSDADERTIRGRQGRKRAAAIALDYLFFDFRDLVRNKVSVLFVAGDQSEQFTKLAKETTGTDNIQAEALYDQLVSKLDKSIIERSRENSAYVIEVGMKYLQDAAIDLGIKSMPLPVYNQKYETQISSLEDAKQLLKRVIREQIGPELQMLFIIDHAARIFYKENVEGKFFPIVVTVKNSNELNEAIFSLSALRNKHIVIGAGQTDASVDVNLDEVNEEQVLETLKQIKTKLK